MLALAAAGNIFFFASLRFGLAEAIGRYETVLRYPPLAKFIYLPAYLLLGVNEAAPRAMQFALLVLAIVYLLRILKLMKADPPPRLAYLLAAFFPTFFNLGTSSELEAGTVLFFAASIFHFMKAAATVSGKSSSNALLDGGRLLHNSRSSAWCALCPGAGRTWFAYPQRRGLAIRAEAWAHALFGLLFILLSAAYGR